MQDVTKVIFLPGLNSEIVQEIANHCNLECDITHEAGGLYVVKGSVSQIQQLVTEARPLTSGLAAIYDSLNGAILSISPI